MSPADFQYTSISTTECIGAFFETGSSGIGGGTPSWIIGDAFLVRINISLFARFHPPSLSIAALALLIVHRSTCHPSSFANDQTSTQKNVYSVFRYNPPSVGFAALSEVAIAQNGVNGAAPTPTIGTVAAAVTNTNGATSRVRVRGGLGHVTLVGMLVTTMALLVL